MNIGSDLLPSVTGSNVTVDSPDPFSKFNNNNNRPSYSHTNASNSRRSKLSGDLKKNTDSRNISINMANKNDVFTKTFSPFKPDYEEICREVRSPLPITITTPVSNR